MNNKKKEEKYSVRKAKKLLNKSISLGNKMIMDMDPADPNYKSACEGVENLCKARAELRTDNLRWIMPAVVSISTMLIYIYCDTHNIAFIGNIKSFFQKQKI